MAKTSIRDSASNVKPHKSMLQRIHESGGKYNPGYATEDDQNEVITLIKDGIIHLEKEPSKWQGLPDDTYCVLNELGDSGTMLVKYAYLGQPFDHHTFTAILFETPSFVVTGIERADSRDGYILHNPQYPIGIGVSPYLALTYKRNEAVSA